MEINIQSICEAICNILSCQLTENENDYEFEINWGSTEKIIIKTEKSEFTNIIDNLSSLNEKNQTILYNSKYYEVLVTEEIRHRPSIMFRDEIISKEDTENGISYQLSLPSREYLAYLLVKMNESENLRRYPLVRMRLKRYFERENDFTDIFKVVLRALSHLMCLQIKTVRSKNIDDFIKYSTSFLFQLSYNTNTPLVETRYLDDIISSNRILYGRRSRINEIEPPKRIYLESLTYHYQMAIGSESPLLAYISFYHIAEHYYEKIYTDDLIKGIQDKITLPDFSSKRRKDINDLIKYINKRLRIRGEENIFNEQEALKLTLKNFVDIEEIKNKLNDYDESLIEYYNTIVVKFSGGDTVDLLNPDLEQLFDKLSKRIYKTRNAIVHSKESEKSKYIPFEDDKILIKEIPLIRFIAEEIIIKNSSQLA